MVGDNVFCLQCTIQYNILLLLNECVHILTTKGFYDDRCL